MLRVRSTVLRATSATSASDAPRSASAPAIFSTNTVAPVPRRPTPRIGVRGGVVVDDHDVDRDPLVLGELRCVAEVEDVAGVVLDDEQDSRAAVDGPRSGEYLIGGRAR